MKQHFGVYLAGPITGESYEGGVDWRQYVMDNLPPEIKAYSPLRAKTYLKDETSFQHSYEQHLLSSQRGIFTRDMSDCQRLDGAIVNFLDAKRVSIGTVMEITAFWWQQKPIVLMMHEGNHHDHPMIREACPFIVRSLDEAIYTMSVILLPVGH